MSEIEHTKEKVDDMLDEITRAKQYIGVEGNSHITRTNSANIHE